MINVDRKPGVKLVTDKPVKLVKSTGVRYPVFYNGDRVKMTNHAGLDTGERFRVIGERWDSDRESLLLRSEWGGVNFWLPALKLAKVPEEQQRSFLRRLLDRVQS